MANSPSARKRIRQTHRRTERAVARRSRARRFVRICEDAISADAISAKEQTGEAKSSQPSPAEALRKATSELHRAAQKGAMHKKAVSRKIARLARRLLSQTRSHSAGEANATSE